MHSGDTSYVIASTIGVLMMVLPGFVLYYAGMVHEGKVVKVVEVVLSIFCVVTLAWFAFGYSLSFAPVTSARADSTPIYGDGTRLWLRGLKRGSVHQNAPTVPEATYCSFQLAFAIVTSVLVIGSVADRVKLGSACLFTLLWHLVVYCPIAHAVWHKDGFLFQAGVLDFAGGNVVHISSGCSALVACAIVGNKYGFSKSRFFPSNMLSTFTGVCLLSIGWMGFNGGSAVNASSGEASMAVLNTIIAFAAGSISWSFLDSALNVGNAGFDEFRKDGGSFFGMTNGCIAGLVAITPACGFVDANGAFWIGVIGGLGCNLGAKLKHHVGWDDALDAFGIHATGGTIGTILAGFFAVPMYSNGAGSVFYSGVEAGGRQLGVQIYAVVVCAAWSALATLAIIVPIDLTLGMRCPDADELCLTKGMADTLNKERRGSDGRSLPPLPLSRDPEAVSGGDGFSPVLPSIPESE